MTAIARLQISCLGSFQATLDGDPIRNFGTDKVRGLLIYLVLEADRAHSREFLASLFWPELPGNKAQHNFRQALATLRKALKMDENETPEEKQPYLLISRNAVQFNLQSDHWLDVKLFTHLLDRALIYHQRQTTSS